MNVAIQGQRNAVGLRFKIEIIEDLIAPGGLDVLLKDPP